ncbi:glycosyltransferase family 2 protein [Radiobacillus sp. PE A8.2]|uniref:glycosyltransferase family 2 protein n=1 Tax=Radiobacillus sp. PE A8.2 TaxID=3380349 RepID=UPI00388CFC7F
MINPKVTIITVSYNSENTIRDTMQSVLNQTYENIEYIIIDGNSKDNTVAIAKEFEQQFNGRLKVVSEPDQGIYDAMNKGIKLASGELVGIINSDDWYEVNSVEIMVDNYRRNSDCILYGILKMVKNEQVYYLKCLSHEFLGENMIQHPTCFIPKRLYDTYGLYDTNYKISADYELVNRYKQQGVKFCRVERVISNFRLGGASTGNLGPIESLHIKYKYNHISKKSLYVGLFNLQQKKIISKLRKR